MSGPQVSVELFPPKSNQHRFWRCVGQLETLEPAFVSITCGAFASASDSAFETVNAVNRHTRLRVCAHVPLSAFPGYQSIEAVDRLYASGVRRVMLLRGDGEPTSPTPCVVDVVDRVRQRHAIDIAVACYPETHPLAQSPAADLDQLLRKQDAGATRAVAQMVFDADTFLRFRDRYAAAGLELPLHAGVLPVTHFDRVLQMAGRCGAAVPSVYHLAFEGTDGNTTVQRELGIGFARELCERLTTEGVDGLHLYALNNPGTAHEVFASSAPAARNVGLLSAA